MIVDPNNTAAMMSINSEDVTFDAEWENVESEAKKRSIQKRKGFP